MIYWIHEGFWNVNCEGSSPVFLSSLLLVWKESLYMYNRYENDNTVFLKEKQWCVSLSKKKNNDV